MNGALYVVATPIGNLGDVTFRAVEVLKTADIILAEDTRTAGVLLKRLNIKKTAVSYHKFNEKARSENILDGLFSGKNIALISDAGTPCISDPGHVLIKEAAVNGIQIITVPGPDAVTAALSVSGFEIKSYAFYGFPPRKMGEIAELLNKVKNDSQRVAVFYESPKRIIGFLETLGEIFPGAELCLVNDMTKKFERIYRGTAGSVMDELNKNPDREKGEYTLVVDKKNNEKKAPVEKELSAEAMLIDAMVKNNLDLKEAVNAVSIAMKRSVSKKEIYAAGLNLKKIFEKAD